MKSQSKVGTISHGGFTKWNGGDCPIDGNTVVQVLFRDGRVGQGSFTSSYSWSHIGAISDIVAYRELMGRVDQDAPFPFDDPAAIDAVADAEKVKLNAQHKATLEKESALKAQEGGSHYKDLAIQPVEFIHANNIGYMEGNVIKYLVRWRNKNGIQDLKKARHYIDLLIEMEGTKNV